MTNDEKQKLKEFREFMVVGHKMLINMNRDRTFCEYIEYVLEKFDELFNLGDEETPAEIVTESIKEYMPQLESEISIEHNIFEKFKKLIEDEGKSTNLPLMYKISEDDVNYIKGTNNTIVEYSEPASRLLDVKVQGKVTNGENDENN